MSDAFHPALPHGPLEEVLPDVFVVRGGFRFGPAVSIARNMTVLRRGDELTVMNSVRLTEEGMAALDRLGRVKHLVRLGFFHGIDDPYFMARYEPAFWSGKRVVPANVPEDKRHDLVDGATTPWGARAFRFAQGAFDEAALLLDDAGGILVTCDSVQNWTSTEGCSLAGGIMMRALGFMEPAKVGPMWLKKMTPPGSGTSLKADFERLAALPFRHLVAGHGSLLKDDAREKVLASVKKTFG